MLHLGGDHSLLPMTTAGPLDPQGKRVYSEQVRNTAISGFRFI